MPVSQTSAIWARSSSAFAFRNGTSDGEPLSSSPSSRIVSRPGSRPVTAFQARTASMKVISWPLSSEAPRPKIAGPRGPSAIAGSKGGRVQSATGSTGCTS
jgi:hypothetical protein